MKTSTIAAAALALMTTQPVIADSNAWETYCSEPTPENAKKVNTAKSRNDNLAELEEGLAVLEYQILCRDVEAVSLAYRLKREADGAYSEILSEMLGRLIRLQTRCVSELQNQVWAIDAAITETIKAEQE